MRHVTLILLALASLACAAGCATMGYRTEGVQIDDLYGTWNWVEPVRRDSTALRGQLVLKPDGTYSFTKYPEDYPGGSGPTWAGSSRSGRFGAYRTVGQDSLYPWIELEHAGATEQRVLQFVGPDTLLLRQGDSGYAVAGSDVDLFVRAPLGQPSSQLSPRDRTYDEEPVPLKQVQPTYPEFAREAQIQGSVVLDVLVDEDGGVRNVAVVKGIKGLNEAAIDAVKKWTFKPAVKNGLPVAGWVEVPMDFHF